MVSGDHNPRATARLREVYTIARGQKMKERNDLPNSAWNEKDLRVLDDKNLYTHTQRNVRWSPFTPSHIKDLQSQPKVWFH